MKVSRSDKAVSLQARASSTDARVLREDSQYLPATRAIFYAMWPDGQEKGEAISTPSAIGRSLGTLVGLPIGAVIDLSSLPFRVGLDLVFGTHTFRGRRLDALPWE